jgi:riboflavin transporter FmnP
MAALAAVASVLEIIPFDLRIPFPLLTFLTFDPTGIPIAVAAVLYGPVGAFVTAGIAGITIATRNPISASFKTAAEMSTAVPLALTLWGLRGRRTSERSGTLVLMAIAGAVAIASRVAVMTGFNLVFLPLLLGIPETVVLGLLAPIAIFNAAQGVINVIPAFLIVRGLPPDLKPSWLARGTG